MFPDSAAHDTVFKGFSGTVVDMGANNLITGGAGQGQAGTGQRVRDASRLRNDAMHDAIGARGQHGALP